MTPNAADDPLAFVSVEMFDTSIGTNEQTKQEEEKEQEKAIDLKVEKPVAIEKKVKVVSNGRLADIRDKHMIKLITNRRCCRICRSKGLLDHLDNSHYHTKISLILHTLWRHRGASESAKSSQMQCRECSTFFDQRYKLILHQKLTNHTGLLTKKRSKQQTPRKIKNGLSKSAKGVKARNGEHGHTNGKSKRKQRKRKPRRRCFTMKRKK
uniref:C2H2-type domain-containing protein n=1 Tax=Anopheles maculatus TaxID=74869 RepID=A0A182SE26_9DIPT